MTFALGLFSNTCMLDVALNTQNATLITISRVTTGLASTSGDVATVYRIAATVAMNSTVLLRVGSAHFWPLLLFFFF